MISDSVAATPSFSRNPRDPAFYQDPYSFYSALHLGTPTFHWEDYGHRCFAGFRDVNALLRDKRFGRQILHVATREELGLPAPKEHTQAFDLTEKYSLLSIEPPAHTRLRNLVNRAFVSRHVEQLRPRIEKLANELIDRFEAQGSTELIHFYAAPIPAIIIAEMIGLPAEMAMQLVAWSNTMVQMYMFGVTYEKELEAEQASVEFMDYIRSVIAERRKSPREDLLTHMLTAEVDGEKLTEEEVISTAILLLNAGHEATVHTTGNAVKTILESGIDPRQIFADDKQTEATVEECLRFDAPLHMFTRYALSDVTLDGGQSFKKGEVIGLMLGAANRDPKRFADADRFDPFRTDGAHVSFGAGIHFCIGAPLARIELQVSLATLFKRLPALKLEGAPRYNNVYHFHGLERLGRQLVSERNELAAQYRAYIDCLNARDWARLGDFVADDAVHNGRSFGLSGYKRMLEQDVDAIPDLRFTIDFMAVDPPVVAARLVFDCRPRGAFLGLPVNGHRVVFSENVFYQFSSGKISEVWSAIDRSAIESQI